MKNKLLLVALPLFMGMVNSYIQDIDYLPGALNTEKKAAGTNGMHGWIAQDGNMPAVFPGGDTAWNHYLDTAFNNRNIARQMTVKDFERFGKTQEVVYTFNILTDGSIGLINIESKVSQAVRNEVYRVLKNAPRWMPATLNGKLSTYRKRQLSTFRFE